MVHFRHQICTLHHVDFVPEELEPVNGSEFFAFKALYLTLTHALNISWGEEIYLFFLVEVWRVWEERNRMTYDRYIWTIRRGRFDISLYGGTMKQTNSPWPSPPLPSLPHLNPSLTLIRFIWAIDDLLNLFQSYPVGSCTNTGGIYASLKSRKKVRWWSPVIRKKWRSKHGRRVISLIALFFIIIYSLSSVNDDFIHQFNPPGAIWSGLVRSNLIKPARRDEPSSCELETNDSILWREEPSRWSSRRSFPAVIFIIRKRDLKISRKTKKKLKKEKRRRAVCGGKSVGTRGKGECRVREGWSKTISMGILQNSRTMWSVLLIIRLPRETKADVDNTENGR